ncbi:hypothetical protein MTR67_009012 [Solanum verrucosum]|uniref:Pectinesterase inhibitor domain-containing protein n=1 Tax=Solanum verrucosum TaxID=315347 RepID=A0AAF0Q2H5_SOLVR|nr:pectinesterase inhibitor-like [Solanum verrucosum]WMV15627.1 hypothetical protein MTR67_009012 [Solanum verrucosum]
MTLSHSSAPFLIVSLLLISVTLTSVKADLIDDICSKTQKNDVCLSVLREDPRSKDSNLKDLMTIAIDLSQKNTQYVRNLVAMLFNKETNSTLKTRYSLCWENYNDAIANLGYLPDLLKSKDYEVLNTHASAALSDPSKCDANFSEPPVEPIQLKVANENLRELIDIILVINKLLKG